MKKKVESEPKNFYGCNPDIIIIYELEFKGQIIKPGTLIKIKNVRGTFIFKNLAHNIKKDVQWIDCIENQTGRYKAFRVDQLKLIVVPKKSRRKKQVV